MKRKQNEEHQKEESNENNITKQRLFTIKIVEKRKIQCSVIDDKGKEEYIQLHDQEELYLTGKELNEYYYWEKQVIFNKILDDSKYVSVLPNNPCLLEINIDGLSSMSGNNIVYNHEHNILFATKYELAKSVMGSFQDILCY